MTPTIMTNRIHHVLLTYETRPMVWVLGAAYAIAFCIAAICDFHIVGGESVAPGLPQSGRALALTDPDSIQKFDEGTFDRKTRAATIFWQDETAGGRGAERIWPDGRREQVFYPPFSARHLRQLRECPRLKVLDLRFRGRLKDDEWQALGDLDQLEALKYDGAVSPFGMRQIARLARLHTLDLSGCKFDEGLEGLESLEHLQTLVMDNFVEDRVNLLGELRRLPHLAALVSTRYQTAGSKVPRNVWESDLDDLQAAPSLRKWFVDEKASGFPGFDALNREVRPIAVRPVQADTGRQWKCIAVIVLNSILIGLLSTQLSSQFASPAARLVPEYATPHLVPATVIWLSGILASAWPLVSMGVPFLASVGVSMAVWLPLGALGLMRPQSHRWITIPLGVAAASAVLWVLGVALFNRSAFDWFLRGEQPGLALAIITAGVLCYAEFARQTCRAYIEYEEMGVRTPPLGLNFAEWSAWQQQIIWRRQGERSGKSWWGNLADRRLSRAIDRAARPGWRNRSNLWIAGNGMSGKLALRSVVPFLIFTGILFFPRIWGGSDWNFFDMFDMPEAPLVMMMLMLPDVSFLVLGVVWRGRRRLLAIESLRPLSRRQFVRETTTALAWDFAPLAFFYLLLAVVLSLFANPVKWTPLWTVSLMFYLIARVAGVCGGISWLNTIRRNWVAVLVAIPIGYAYLLAGIGSLFMFLPGLGVADLPPDMPDLSHGLLLAIGLAWALLAGAIMALACRRWMRLELGEPALRA